MEPQRTSSVYSTDSTRKPTYLDYRNGVETRSRPGSFKAAREYAQSLASQTREMQVPSRGPPAAPTTTAPGPGSGYRESPPPPANASYDLSYNTPTNTPPPAPPSFSYGSRDSPPPLAPPSTTSGSGSRQSSRHSSRPSFMNYQAPQPKTQPMAVPQSASQPAPVELEAPVRRTVPPGLLLLFVGADVHPRTVHFLGILLKRRAFSGIAIIGSKEHETAIKQLKMDVYGLIGKLGREMGVQTHLLLGSSEDELASAVQEALKGKSDTGGVMCSLAYGGEGSDTVDILSAERSDLERSWQASVGFLHCVAKVTMPLLTARVGVDAQAGPFLLLESVARSPASLVSKAACETLVCQLSAAYASRDLQVDYAENVLFPEPERKPARTERVPSLQTNGFSAEPAEPSIFTPGESPTKLWNMWALQND